MWSQRHCPVSIEGMGVLFSFFLCSSHQGQLNFLYLIYTMHARPEGTEVGRVATEWICDKWLALLFPQSRRRNPQAPWWSQTSQRPALRSPGRRQSRMADPPSPTTPLRNERRGRPAGLWSSVSLLIAWPACCSTCRKVKTFMSGSRLRTLPACLCPWSPSRPSCPRVHTVSWLAGERGWGGGRG